MHIHAQFKFIKMLLINDNLISYYGRFQCIFNTSELRTNLLRGSMLTIRVLAHVWRKRKSFLFQIMLYLIDLPR